ncbi:MAG: hypothetical protein AAGK78_09540 [Planctomycetota bacterium]
MPAFQVRPGYFVSLAADDLDEARFLEHDGQGTVFLSQPKRGAILALRDTDGDGTFETRSDFVTDQSNCHGMDFEGGWLWYTSSAAGYLRKARDTDGDGLADEIVDVVEAGSDLIPAGGGHPFRGVLVEPAKNRVLITVSDPGNMNADLESDRKKVYAFDLDGTNRRVFASGIRNTEKLRHRIDARGESTDEVWGADHGSDWFGRVYGDARGNQPITDLLPPDELNHLEEGRFYGHPFIVGDRIPRPEFADRDDLHELAARTTPPAWNYGAHVATNGFDFLGSAVAGTFGDDHVGDLFQAQHGSWNSSVPVGYAVTRVLFDEHTGRPFGELAIVVTHPGEGRPLARPVDCMAMPDGSVLWSCNVTGRLFRITAERASTK